MRKDIVFLWMWSNIYLNMDIEPRILLGMYPSNQRCLHMHIRPFSNLLHYTSKLRVPATNVKCKTANKMYKFPESWKSIDKINSILHLNLFYR